MKKETTAARLKKLLHDRGLRQIDILNACQPYCQKYDIKMNKSNISQYLSGTAEPNQDKLFVLGNALNVSEAWLMGYDVPAERTERIIPISKTNIITEYAEKLHHIYNDLNARGKEKLIDTAIEMTFNPLYNDNYQKVIAAHSRTDIEVTGEMIKHDNDIMSDDSEWE